MQTDTTPPSELGEPYAPVPRNRAEERRRLEQSCPGYREERERLEAGEDDDA